MNIHIAYRLTKEFVSVLTVALALVLALVLKLEMA